MKKISNWAKKHKWQSWLLIAAIHVFLVYLAIYSSILLYLEDIVLPTSLFYLFLTIGGAAYLVYPIKGIKKGLFKSSFEKRKGLEFTIIISSFCMIFLMFNQLAHVNHQETRRPSQSEARTVILVPEAKKSTTNEVKKWLKKRHQKRVKRIKKLWQKSSNREQGLLIFSTLFLIFLAAIGVSFLGCSIGCNGLGALGFAIMLIKWTAIIFGLTAIIRNIVRKRKKPESPPPVSEDYP